MGGLAWWWLRFCYVVVARVVVVGGYDIVGICSICCCVVSEVLLDTHFEFVGASASPTFLLVALLCCDRSVGRVYSCCVCGCVGNNWIGC